MARCREYILISRLLILYKYVVRNMVRLGTNAMDYSTYCDGKLSEYECRIIVSL